MADYGLLAPSGQYTYVTTLLYSTAYKHIPQGSSKASDGRWCYSPHASWPSVTKETADERRALGLPCPLNGYTGFSTAMPATTDEVSILAKAGSSLDPIVEEEEAEDEAPA